MDYQVFLSAKARTDLRSVTAYIARDDAAAAVRFSEKMLDYALSLSRSPYQGMSVEERPEIRKIIFWPYVIYYRVNQEEAGVVILRFWHGARNPKSLSFGSSDD